MDIFNIANHEILLKLTIAGTLSLIIGLERELKKKPVGLKTSMVIACFSCLLTVISIESAYSTPPRDDINITMDPLRLAAQIVSGIGFLGAGVILRRGNDSITGLTTAAMIWGAAGIGIAVGAGFYIQATLSVLVVFVGIEIIAPTVIRFGPKRLRTREGSLKICINDIDQLPELFERLKEQGLIMGSFSIKDVRIDSEILHDIYFKFSCLNTDNTITIYTALTSLEYVKQVDLEYLY